MKFMKTLTININHCLECPFCRYLDNYDGYRAEDMGHDAMEEILEANGFGRDPLYYEHNDGYDFFLGNVRSVHVGPLQYVHELQHALRLCGLNEIADNFKI